MKGGIGINRLILPANGEVALQDQVVIIVEIVEINRAREKYEISDCGTRPAKCTRKIGS